MISSRFLKVIEESPPGVSVTGVLRWDAGPGVQAAAGDAARLQSIKQPVLSGLAANERFAVNNLEALPSAIVLAPAADWLALIRSKSPDLDAAGVWLDTNVEIPMVD